MLQTLRLAALAVALCCATPVASANVITDWDEKAVPVVPFSSEGERVMAMVHVAMFDAVNSIEPRCLPYLVQLPAPSGASIDAAAAAAAGTVLVGAPTMSPSAVAAMKAAMAAYLAAMPEGEAKASGVRLGEAVALKVLEARAHDGATDPDSYRPKTKPGVYIPTPITASSTWPALQPFVLKSPSQFRPKPPIDLTSPEYAADYNELKDYGGKSSAKRSPQQTETARFWLMVGPPAYHPLARQIVTQKGMTVSDSARFMALYSVALTDAYIAVFDAKYEYEFWRPITAIRNGDMTGNPATAREASWQPLDNTPMHPEYPCAHCIESGAATAVIEAVLGTAEIHEIAMTSSTAPGVTHRWTSLDDLADEVANSRIWAGFHYRFSTRVGTEMGRQIGRYVVETVMRPAT